MPILNPPPLHGPIGGVQVGDEGLDVLVTESWAKFFAFLIDAIQYAIDHSGTASSVTSAWITDTYAGVYTANLTAGWNHQVTATGAIAVQVPSAGTSGKPVKIRIVQDATGGRQVTLAAGWKNAQADPGYQEALTSCIIDGIFYSPTVVFVNYITENIPA